MGFQGQFHPPASETRPLPENQDARRKRVPGAAEGIPVGSGIDPSWDLNLWGISWGYPWIIYGI